MTTTTRRFIDLRPGQEPKLRDSACTVAHAVRLQMYGVTDEEILAIYPLLTSEHLRAAMAYAADLGDRFVLAPDRRCA